MYLQQYKIIDLKLHKNIFVINQESLRTLIKILIFSIKVLFLSQMPYLYNQNKA
jgi:hypothetical protein